MDLHRYVNFNSEEQVLVDKSRLKKLLLNLMVMTDQANEVSRDEQDMHSYLYLLGQVTSDSEKFISTIENLHETSEMKKVYDEIHSEMEQAIQKEVGADLTKEIVDGDKPEKIKSYFG